ncbi:MAG: hypothetical protein ABW168_18745 [Sedimenticola sp.]
MIRLFATALLIATLSGCSLFVPREGLNMDGALVNDYHAQVIADDWAQILTERFVVETIFSITGSGAITQAFTKSMRTGGYGVATDDQLIESAIPIEIRTGNLDNGVVVSLIMKSEIMSRSYRIDDKKSIQPNSQISMIVIRDSK